eukprot:13630347-Alexandrium_andersonii.AAC.1
MEQCAQVVAHGRTSHEALDSPRVLKPYALAPRAEERACAETTPDVLPRRRRISRAPLTPSASVHRLGTARWPTTCLADRAATTASEHHSEIRLISECSPAEQ